MFVSAIEMILFSYKKLFAPLKSITSINIRKEKANSWYVVRYCSSNADNAQNMYKLFVGNLNKLLKQNECWAKLSHDD